MNKEEILLDVLNEHGDFENVRQQFDENDLACILEAMERYKGQTLPIDSVVGQSEQLPKCEHKNIIREDGLDECLDCGVRNY